jgi:hypothetical protein
MLEVWEDLKEVYYSLYKGTGYKGSLCNSIIPDEKVYIVHSFFHTRSLKYHKKAEE